MPWINPQPPALVADTGLLSRRAYSWPLNSFGWGEGCGRRLQQKCIVTASASMDQLDQIYGLVRTFRTATAYQQPHIEV